MENELFPHELERIRWRSFLMAIPGGVEWLVHVSRLYDGREQLIGPRHIGLPDDLRVKMHFLDPSRAHRPIQRTWATVHDSTST